jgi:hypothetical protein
MRKDSIAIGGLSLLITAAVVGGAWYLAQQEPKTPPSPEEAAWTTLEPGAVDASSVPDVAAETSSARGDQILECHDPKVGKFYTNAASCAEADVHNRLSIAQPLASAQKPRPYSGTEYKSPAEQAKESRQSKPKKPNLRLLAKAPPSGLNPACTFAVGKALELERDLSTVRDPSKSIWREDYCKWRCEAARDNCGVPADTYYYEYRKLCPDQYYYGC